MLFDRPVPRSADVLELGIDLVERVQLPEAFEPRGQLSNKLQIITAVVILRRAGTGQRVELFFSVLAKQFMDFIAPGDIIAAKERLIDQHGEGAQIHASDLLGGFASESAMKNGEARKQRLFLL